MSWISKIQQKLLGLKYKLFPESFKITPKGLAVRDYCYKILTEDLKDTDKIEEYENILKRIQGSLNTSRTFAAIYILSVMGDIPER